YLVHSLLLFSLLLILLSTISSLFPYTTLFRSDGAHVGGGHRLGFTGCRNRCRRVRPMPLPAGCPGALRRRALGLFHVGGIIALGDRKSTRLNSSHVKISYAVFFLKKKI